MSGIFLFVEVLKEILNIKKYKSEVDRCPRNAFNVTDNALLLFKINKARKYVPSIPFLFVTNWKPKKKEFRKVYLYYIIGVKHFFS